MDADQDERVEFLYKTMLERDPCKRRVKPVQHHLLQLDFGGLGDSSDDSDFEVTEHKDEDEDSGSSGSEQGSSDEESESGSDDQKASSLKDNFYQDSNPLDDVISLDSVSVAGGDSLDRAQPIKAPSEETAISSVGSSRKMKIIICCVCLSDASGEQDEIVECDGCGISVHEGCYGISDTQSVASTVSSASTEPWFCDSCKAGLKPICELCPNEGGVFKETDAGRWVHIVCALYIPGVAFGDVDKLSQVTLFEMPYTKWGARDCTLCEDDRFCSAGVCISCDAGMCRTYFHVTCAQREGLLSEASPDEDIADPFFAYCKQHADKSVARAKRRNFLAIQSNMRQGKEKDFGDEKEKLRVQRKLTRHKQKYQLARAQRPPSWVPNQKMPRMIFSSPSATRRLLRKAELLGISTQPHHSTSQKDISKKWHVAPSFNVEFISYFLDRCERMGKMDRHMKDLQSQREKLQAHERLLRLKYEKSLDDLTELRDQGNTLLQGAEGLWQQLEQMYGKPLKLPEVLKPKKPPVKTVPKTKDTSKSPNTTVIHQCGLCHKTNNQHQLAKCDACHLYYHLGCLDPPLTRMPKKTKLMGWQCSECVSSGSSDSEDPDVDPDAPRRLRENIKEPLKFTPSLIKSKQRRRSEVTKGLAKTGRMQKKLAMKTAAETSKTELQKKEVPEQKPQQTVKKVTKPAEKVSPVKPDLKPKKVNRAAPSKKAKVIKEQIVECCVCLKQGDANTDSVRCDNCGLSYHFGCLDPPLTKSPKYRGYAWFCTACEEDEDDDDEEEPEIAAAFQKSVRPSPLRRPRAAIGLMNPTSGTSPVIDTLAMAMTPSPNLSTPSPSVRSTIHSPCVGSPLTSSSGASPIGDPPSPKSPSDPPSSKDPSSGSVSPSVSSSSVKWMNYPSPGVLMTSSPNNSPSPDLIITGATVIPSRLKTALPSLTVQKKDIPEPKELLSQLPTLKVHSPEDRGHGRVLPGVRVARADGTSSHQESVETPGHFNTSMIFSSVVDLTSDDDEPTGSKRAKTN